MNERRTIKLQRLLSVELLRLRRRDVRHLCHRVLVLPIGLATLNVLQSGKKRRPVALQLTLQIVPTQ